MGLKESIDKEGNGMGKYEIKSRRDGGRYKEIHR